MNDFKFGDEIEFVSSDTGEKKWSRGKYAGLYAYGGSHNGYVIVCEDGYAVSVPSSATRRPHKVIKQMMQMWHEKRGEQFIVMIVGCIPVSDGWWIKAGEPFEMTCEVPVKSE